MDIDIVQAIGSYKGKDEYPQFSDVLHKLVQEGANRDDITLNFNEEGRLHSRYLDDRYEPAIIFHGYQSISYYYLFDGEIKDCIHPLNVEMHATIKRITYYSSERIKQELPIGITEDETTVFETYNQYNSEPLIEGYKNGQVKINIVDYVKKDYLIHEYMEPPMTFKFVD